MIVKKLNNHPDFIVSKTLTMKSARNNELFETGDIVAEIFCQEILTSNGFQFNLTTNSEVNNMLETIKAIISNIRTEFEGEISGTLIRVGVALEA